MFWNFFRGKDTYIKKVVQLEMSELMTKMDMDLKFMQPMQKLDIKDGDIIVLRHPFVLSEKAQTMLRISVSEIIKESGYDIKVIVLEEGMEIGVLRNIKPV